MHTTDQTILDGIAFTIRDAFPQPGVGIFRDRIPQGTEKRTFFIRQISGARRKRLGVLYGGGVTRGRMRQADALFEITYFPAADVGAEEAECRAIQEGLLDLLELIPAADGALLQGESINGNISDGVLVVTVKFQYSILWKPEDNQMGRIKFRLPWQNTRTQGGQEYGSTN